MSGTRPLTAMIAVGDTGFEAGLLRTPGQIGLYPIPRLSGRNGRLAGQQFRSGNVVAATRVVVGDECMDPDRDPGSGCAIRALLVTGGVALRLPDLQPQPTRVWHGEPAGAPGHAAAVGRSLSAGSRFIGHVQMAGGGP